MSHKDLTNQRVVGLYYSIDNLRALPEKEQEVYLAACQLINELGMLSKQMLYAFNFGEDGDLPVKLAQDSMGFLNMRHLAGRIVEGWNFLKQNKAHIYRLTDSNFSDGFNDDFELLDRLVGNSHCPIKKIRHRYAFHANVKYLREQLEKHPDDEFIEFIGEQNGNMFFHGTDLVVLNAVIDAQKEDGGLDDLRQLQSDVTSAAGAISRISKHVAASIFQRIYPSASTGKKEEWIIQMPELTKVVAPFFAHLTEK